MPLQFLDNNAALALQAQASTTFIQAQQHFEAIKASLDSETSLQLQSQLIAIQNLLGQGATDVASGNIAAGQDAFNRVVRLSVRLDAFFKAGKKFNTKLLSSLLATDRANREKNNEEKGRKGKGGEDNGSSTINIQNTNILNNNSLNISGKDTATTVSTSTVQITTSTSSTSSSGKSDAKIESHIEGSSNIEVRIDN